MRNPAWHEAVAAAGLTQEHVDERPSEPAMRERVYRLWVTHADQLRHELGETPVENMLREHTRCSPSSAEGGAVPLTLRRLPEDPAAPAVVDRMAGPSRQAGNGHASGERTPQCTSTTSVRRCFRPGPGAPPWARSWPTLAPA